jgi:putative ABC transport system ATP-binding protein
MVTDWVIRFTDLRHELVNRQTAETYRLEIDKLIIPRGKFVAIQGPSGCGKTSLLTLLGLARRPYRESDSSPAVTNFEFSEFSSVNGAEVCDLKQAWEKGPRQIDSLRRRLLGFCLQRGELLENLTVEQNVCLPLGLNGWSRRDSKARCEEILRQLSIEFSNHAPENGSHQAGAELVTRHRHLPSQLSGGQYQRVALARALAHKPQVLFLDEPTGSLDPKKAEEVLTTLEKIRLDEGVTIVMITHDARLAAEFAEFVIEMSSPEKGLGAITARKCKLESGEWVHADADWNPRPAVAPVHAESNGTVPREEILAVTGE